MKITQISMTDFLLVRDSGITKITVDFSENVQLIIGANGVGKSQLVKQLSAFPSVRTIFGKRGYKILTVEKDGVEYRLVSEYEKPSSPHAFCEGDSDDNLNVGRTTETQKELIAEHLGITPFLDDLIMNRYEFPKWTASKRKDFLMAHNPDDIGFVLQLAKQQAQKIRACKNNIARLQSRKILLEQDLLSDEVIAELEAEKIKISEDLARFQQDLMNIEVGLRTLTTSFVDSGYDPKSLTLTLKRSRYALHGLSNVSRDDKQRGLDRDKLVGELASCDNQIKLTDEEIISKSSELAELEVHYKELIPDGDLREIEDTINRLEKDRDRLHIQAPPFELTREELDRLYTDWQTIREQLLIFENCDVPLYSRKKRSHRERQLELISYRKSSYEMKLSDLKSQYEALSKRHTLSPKDIPNSPCAKEACPLYSHFFEEYNHAEEKRQALISQISSIEKKHKRAEQFTSEATRFFHDTRLYQDRIQELISRAQGNPILHMVLRGLDVLSTLKTNPNRISQKFKEALDNVDQWLKLKTVLTDLETAYTLKSRFMGSQDHDTVKLVVGIENLKKALTGLRNAVLTYIDKRQQIHQHILDIEKYESIKQTVLTIEQNQKSHLTTLSDNHEKERLLFLKRGIEEIRSQMFVRMSEVERTLRAQSGIKERYQEEIINELNRIEKELSDLEQIEKALIAIPKNNTIHFVNGIIEQANRLIRAVWTLPFQIEPVNPEDNLDYTFKVSGDNQTIREMSECSEGQTDMLSLAINLALRIQLGYLNYPLILDEVGRTFDTRHKQNLVVLLKQLLDTGVISQLFYVSHDLEVHSGFNNAETLVLGNTNVVTPEVFNNHAVII